VIVRYTLYAVITLFLFVPFAMTVLSSFKTSAEVIAFPPTLLPAVWHPENYLRVFTETQNFPRQVFNGFFVTLIIVALNLFFDALVGYAFARLEFPFKNLLFALMIGTMVIPGFVFFVPRFIMLQHAGLINTYGALPVLYFVQPAYILADDPVLQEHSERAGGGGHHGRPRLVRHLLEDRDAAGAAGVAGHRHPHLRRHVEQLP